jgi:molecular chaperone DnaK (HSP70)
VRLCAALLLALPVACKTSTRPPSLDEGISVEQPGGSASQLFSQGTELPASATESFTTAKDDEKRLYVHVLRGSGHSSEKLKSDGWWTVDGVGTGRAGVPQVMVTFELDARGDLSLSAREGDRRLTVGRLDRPQAQLTPSPLTEPDDDEDSEDDPE